MTTRKHHEEAEPEPEPKAAPKARPLAAGPGTFRVSLAGVRPLLDGVAQDYLDIEAETPEEAWEKFQIANGILSTTHKPEIFRLPEGPQKVG